MCLRFGNLFCSPAIHLSLSPPPLNVKTAVVFSLTSFDLNAKASFRFGTNILGGYKLNTQYNGLEAHYGNIEAVRAMELLNEILPQLGNVRLGTLGVLSSINNASYRKYDIG